MKSFPIASLVSLATAALLAAGQQNPAKPSPEPVVTPAVVADRLETTWTGCVRQESETKAFLFERVPSASARSSQAAEPLLLVSRAETLKLAGHVDRRVRIRASMERDAERRPVLVASSVTPLEGACAVVRR